MESLKKSNAKSKFWSLGAALSFLLFELAVLLTATPSTDPNRHRQHLDECNQAVLQNVSERNNNYFEVFPYETTCGRDSQDHLVELPGPGMPLAMRAFSFARLLLTTIVLLGVLSPDLRNGFGAAFLRTEQLLGRTAVGVNYEHVSALVRKCRAKLPKPNTGAFTTILNSSQKCLNCFFAANLAYCLIRMLLHPEEIFISKSLGCCAAPVGFYIVAALGLGHISDRFKMMSAEDKDAEDSSSEEDDDEENEGEKDDTENITASAVVQFFKRVFWFFAEDAQLQGTRAGLVAITAAGEVFTPLFTGHIFDSVVIEKNSGGWKNESIILMIAVTMISALCFGIRNGMHAVGIARLERRIKDAVFGALLKQDMSFFNEKKSADLTAVLCHKSGEIAHTLSHNICMFIQSTIEISGALIIMTWLSWQLSLLSVLGVPLLGCVAWYIGTQWVQTWRVRHQVFKKMNGQANEVLQSMETVRCFANDKQEVENHYDGLSAMVASDIRRALIDAIYQWSTELLSLGIMIGTLLIGERLTATGRIKAGQLIAFTLYQTLLRHAISRICWVYSDIMRLTAASQKVFAYIDRAPKQDFQKGTHSPTRVEGRIEFKNVSFTYSHRPENPVLQGVSFTAEPGEMIALVGPSGGGKSTCVALLQNFYEPDEGAVLLDGVPVQDYSYKTLHNSISLVAQEPVLFARTIFENITYGWSGPAGNESDADKLRIEVEEVAKQANAHEFISEMKRGYKTLAGEKGKQLSGGQKQRIAIMRALIRNPPVLVLDEATSALDANSEHLVQESIQKARGAGRTIIVIAHRLSTVERADKIVVIKKGEVAEVGDHAQLIKNNSVYAELVKRQLVGSSGIMDGSESSSDDEKETNTEKQKEEDDGPN